MKSSRRDRFIDMVVDRFILKNNQINPFRVSTLYLKQWDYLKQGFSLSCENMQSLRKCKVPCACGKAAIAI